MAEEGEHRLFHGITYQGNLQKEIQQIILAYAKWRTFVYFLCGDGGRFGIIISVEFIGKFCDERLMLLWDWRRGDRGRRFFIMIAGDLLDKRRSLWFGRGLGHSYCRRLSRFVFPA